jgi:hypothetical protein
MLSKEADVVVSVPLADVWVDAASPWPTRTITSSRAIEIDTNVFFI